MDSCIDIFLTHLQKKKEIMSRTLLNYQEQKKLLLEKEVDVEKMDSLLEEMDDLAEQVEGLETEFQQIYPGVAAYIEKNGVDSIRELDKLRTLNREIDKLFSLCQKLIEENREKMSLYFMTQKKEIKQGRTGSRVAYGYYQNMSGAGMGATSTWESRQ